MSLLEFTDFDFIDSSSDHFLLILLVIMIFFYIVYLYMLKVSIPHCECLSVAVSKHLLNEQCMLCCCDCS